MTPSTDGVQPIPALLVATWYPGMEDPGRGRFVADQAEALARTGRVRPLVASFEVAYAENVAGAKRASVVARHLRDAMRSRTDVVSPGGWPATPTIPTARLPVPEPYGRESLPPGQEADARRAALELLSEQLDTGGLAGVVHAHTAYPDGFGALGAAERLGWPLIITEHASFVARQLRQPEHRRRYLEAASAASRFIAVSDTLAAELVAAIPELEPKLEVVPNVIPLGAFRLGDRANRRRDELIFVGNRKERKGIVILLRAFADVLEERPSATLRLIGRSPTHAEEQRWHRMAEDLEVAHAVRFEAPMGRDGVAAALQRASVFVHGSPRETFGVVTLEALASGLPVVATQSGGISGILQDRRLGELVPAQDPRMLARAILRTLNRLDEFDPAVLRGAAERFSGEAVAPRIVQLYEDVMTGSTLRARTAGSGHIRWSGAAEPLDESLVVVGHDTDRAARVLSAMPAAMLARVTLITHGQTQSAELPAGIGRVIETREHVPEQLRRQGLYGARGRLGQRIMRVASDPVGWARRRFLKQDRGERRWQATIAGVARALENESFETADGGPAEIYCIDLMDYAIAAPLITAGRARPTPGGLTWLRDRWDTVGDQAPASASRSLDGSSSESTATSSD